jgi:DNA-directed RNA polymerase beta subunit
MRIGMQSKQGTHTMPILRHTPLLVGSGAERGLAQAIGNTFVYKARSPGRVEKIDTEHGVVALRHEDGTRSYVDLAPRSVKNSGGGFYITSQLSVRDGLREGQRFAADEILALDPSYFAERGGGSVTYKTGLLVRMALVALDQTYEDSIMVTDRLVRNTAALATMSRTVNLGPRANLQSVAKVGDRVDPNTPLAVFENVTEDTDISELLQRVGKEFDDAIADLTKNVAQSKYSGEIVEIRVFYNRDPEELSPSLQRFIRSQDRKAESRRAAVADAPADEPVRVAGPQRVNRSKIGGETLDGVIIQFLIRVLDVAAAGDKYTTSGAALKGIVSRVFEPGEEPVDESGNQVDYIVSPLSVISRMTEDAFMNMWANSCIVGLKERVLAIYNE